MRIVMPLFQFGYLDTGLFIFSGGKLRIDKFNAQEEIPDIDLFSKQDVEHMDLESYAIIIEDDETAGYKILVNSGCVIQREDGYLEVFPPDKAIEEFERMPIKHQRLYHKDYKSKMKKSS